jgi:hypothetical protein
MIHGGHLKGWWCNVFLVIDSQVSKRKLQWQILEAPPAALPARCPALTSLKDLTYYQQFSPKIASAG